MNTFRASALLALALAFSGPSLQASLVYYLPFDNSTSASLANSGTAGGTATAVTGISGATAPSASQAQIAPGLGSTWSEYFPVTGPTEANNRGGAVVLPNSTTEFRLDSSSTANQMTLSTWIYWNGNAGGTITSPAGIAGTMNASNTAGWSFRIQSNGVLKFAWVQTAGGGRNRDTTGSVITAGQWVNAVVVFDSTIGQPVAMYVNGVAQATTGSSGDPLMGIMKSDTNSIATGVSFHNSGQGRQSLNGYEDDFAIWNTALSAAKVKALNTAPALLAGYNAGVMNNLFTAYDTQSTSISGTVTWSYATAFNVSGRGLGDTWLGSDGKYYLWLGGTTGNALGLAGVISGIPEPSGTALLIGLGALFVPLTRRVRKTRR